MSRPMSRQGILDALRAARAAAPLSARLASPPVRPAAVSVGADCWERLAQVLAPLEVRLRVAKTPEQALAHVTDIARERGAGSYARWPELPLGLGEGADAALAGLTRLEIPPALADGTGGRPCPALAGADLGLTGAHAALLDSGSLVLVAGPDAPRSVSLLPAAHVCLIPRSVLAADVSALPGLLEAHRDSAGRLPACLNLVTGPSSTADIELVLVRGVHGPVAVEAVGLDWLPEGEG